MDINELQKNSIEQLNAVFQSNKGENTVTFEIVEFDAVKIIPEVVINAPIVDEENLDVENGIVENPEDIEIEIPVVEIENLVKTRVSLPSRKLKIKISNELLFELEKMNIKFSLN